MESNAIKWKCELQYKKIKDAEEMLKKLRAKCSHQNTFQGLYELRVGNIQNALVCEDCGELLKLIPILSENIIYNNNQPKP